VRKQSFKFAIDASKSNDPGTIRLGGGERLASGLLKPMNPSVVRTMAARLAVALHFRGSVVSPGDVIPSAFGSLADHRKWPRALNRRANAPFCSQIVEQ
jgi:hypothetical protein